MCKLQSSGATSKRLGRLRPNISSSWLESLKSKLAAPSSSSHPKRVDGYNSPRMNAAYKMGEVVLPTSDGYPGKGVQQEAEQVRIKYNQRSA